MLSTERCWGLCMNLCARWHCTPGIAQAQILSPRSSEGYRRQARQKAWPESPKHVFECPLALLILWYLNQARPSDYYINLFARIAFSQGLCIWAIIWEFLYLLRCIHAYSNNALIPPPKNSPFRASPLNSSRLVLLRCVLLQARMRAHDHHARTEAGRTPISFQNEESH